MNLRKIRRDKMPEEELTPQEKKDLKEMFGANLKPDSKESIVNFFNKILVQEDSIKVSNLDQDELASIRGLRDIANFAGFEGLDVINKFYKKEAEVILGSSVSKEGFLIKQLITQKKEIKSRITAGTAKKGWFTKKPKEED